MHNALNVLPKNTRSNKFIWNQYKVIRYILTQEMFNSTIGDLLWLLFVKKRQQAFNNQFGANYINLNKFND